MKSQETPLATPHKSLTIDQTPVVKLLLQATLAPFHFCLQQDPESNQPIQSRNRSWRSNNHELLTNTPTVPQSCQTTPTYEITYNLKARTPMPTHIQLKNHKLLVQGR